MDQLIEILHLEDDQKDIELVFKELELAGLNCHVTPVATRGEFETALKRDGFDIILADVKLHRFDGITALRVTKELHTDIPFVFVSGTKGEDTAIECLTKGASDYVLKQKLNRLAPAVRRALSEADFRRSRRQVEIALRESEAGYRRIVETAAEGIWVLDHNAKITFVNNQMTEILGYHVKEMIGRKFTNFMIEEDLPDHLQKWENRKKGTAENYERRFRCKDGSIVWTRVSASPIFDDARQFTGSFAMFTNITVGKRMEVAMSRMNRELKAISSCNQTLLRSEDEATLLNEICRIICDEAGYLMAWVGYAENNESKAVRPIVWAGAEDGYLSTTNITWDDTERGQGPTGTAVRTGNTTCIQDFRTNEKIAPWRENALQRNYRSNIALPLKNENGLTFGALTIYSDEPEAFTTDEIHLLEELAGNLAFGITSIRIRDERKRAEAQLQESQRKLTDIINFLPDATFAIDNEGKVIAWNKAIEEMTGVSANDMVGKGNFEHAIPFYGKRRPILIDLVFGDKEIANMQYLNVKREKNMLVAEGFIPAMYHGKGAYLWGVASPLYDNNENVVGAIESIRDITDRKHVEEALMESEERYRTLIENQGEGTAIVDIDENITYANPAGEKIFGVPRGGLVGRNLSEFVDPDQMAVINRQTSERKQGQISTYDLAITRSDGEKRFILVTGTPQFNNDGSFVGTFGVFRDITERKQAEEALRYSEERFSKVFRLSPTAIAIFRMDNNRIVDVNDTFVRETGYSRDEIIGSTPSELNLFADQEDAVNIIQKIREKGSVENFEFRTRKKSGEIGVALNSITLIDLAGEKHFMSLIQDITERKKVEDELRKLSRAVEQSPASIVITDTKGRIEYVNSKFTKVTGYKLSEVSGKNPNLLKSGMMPLETYQELWTSIKSGQEWHGELYNRKKDGELFWEFASISPIFDSSGTIAHFLAVKEDITERKQKEIELIEAKEKAVESDRLKSAFLSNMSHEIRTPLNSIIGFSDLILSSGFEPAKQHEFARIINNSGINLLSIINDIMDISKIETGQLHVHKKTFSVTNLLDEIRKEYLFKAIDKGIELRLDKSNPQNEVFLESDETKIRQVIVNLVVNALKFTMEGIIQIGIKVKDDHIRFHIKDTGIGIPAEFHQQIFEPFRQIEPALTRKYGGNGLGLPISKSLVELLGGKMWLESEHGKGSAFYFTIPTGEQQS